MNFRTVTISLALVVTGAFAASSRQQEEGGAPPMARPAKQHELLSKKIGTWDAKMFVMGAEIEAVYECRALGGLWVLGDYSCNFMGAPFAGHDVWGFDPKKGKYVATWVDTWTDQFLHLEGDYDEATKTMTMWGETANNPTGEKIRERHDSKFIDADTWEFTMHHPGPDGKYMEVMKVVYKRRK